MTDIRDLAREMDPTWMVGDNIPAPEPWKRGWGTSWLRTIIGLTVFGATLWLLVFSLAKGPVSQAQYDELFGATDFLQGLGGFDMALMYILYVGTWLDHVVASNGRRMTFMIVAGAGVFWEVQAGNISSAVGPIGILLVAVSFAVAYCFENWLVPNSFENTKRAFRPF